MPSQETPPVLPQPVSPSPSAAPEPSSPPPPSEAAEARARRKKVTRALGALAFQLTFLTPIFWFVELSQNLIYWALEGEPAWIYPKSPYQWFSFESLGLWGGSVVIMWALHYFILLPRGVRLGYRMIIAGTICWAGEWLAGYCATHLLGHPMQVWTNTPFVYVRLSALFFWWWDVLLYQLLVVDIAGLRHARSDKELWFPAKKA